MSKKGCLAFFPALWQRDLKAYDAEWLVVSSSTGPSRPRDRNCISYVAGGFVTTEPREKPTRVYLSKVCCVMLCSSSLPPKRSSFASSPLERGEHSCLSVLDFPGGAVDKNPPASAGDGGSSRRIQSLCSLAMRSLPLAATREKLGQSNKDPEQP